MRHLGIITIVALGSAACGPADDLPALDGGTSNDGSTTQDPAATDSPTEPSTTSASTSEGTSIGETGPGWGDTTTTEATSDDDTTAADSSSTGEPIVCDPAPAGALCLARVEPSSHSIGEGPLAVAVADYDGDGLGDVVTADAYANNLSVLRGAGDGYFWPGFALKVDEVTSPMPFLATDAAFADLDGDGLIDVVGGAIDFDQGIIGPNAIYRFRNVGDGELERLPRTNLPQVPSPIHVGDVDDDGDIDVLAAGGLLRNDGAGELAPSLSLGIDGALGFAIVDFDDDGATDIVVLDHAEILLVAGDGSGGFAAPVGLGFGDALVAIDVADFDGDARPDLAGVLTAGPTVHVELRRGGDLVSPIVSDAAAPPTDGAPLDLASGDLDGDGLRDIVVSSGTAGPGVLDVLLGDGTGGFASAVTLETGVEPHDLVVVDVDGEGRDDIVSVSRVDNTVTVWIHDPCACDPS